MSPVQLTKYFAYLDKLRASGKVNMWGASANLQSHFACGSTEASKAHGLWMESFSKEAKLSERVQAALEKPSRE
jgi:hypothetical protein